MGAGKQKNLPTISTHVLRQNTRRTIPNRLSSVHLTRDLTKKRAREELLPLPPLFRQNDLADGWISQVTNQNNFISKSNQQIVS